MDLIGLRFGRREVTADGDPGGLVNPEVESRLWAAITGLMGCGDATVGTRRHARRQTGTTMCPFRSDSDIEVNQPKSQFSTVFVLLVSVRRRRVRRNLVIFGVFWLFFLS